MAMGDIAVESAELLVFVYGTLKPGGRYHKRYCDRALAEAFPAAVKGRLYNFVQWGYPAMTAGDDWVKGYLLRFCDRAAVCSAVLQRLDSLEGILNSDVSRLDGSGLAESIPKDSVSDDSYQRCWQSVFTPSYEPLQSAWVYRMTDDQVRRFGGVYLSSGDWPV
jgi:gamma-glutamylcyclotransferase (GGCT)/AIG2-like uncharacterized protein YtfP